MTKPVTLSDRAFTALRAVKKKGESDSDVILRLIDNSRATLDPRQYHAKSKIDWSYEEYQQSRRDSREAERRRPDPWA